MRLAFFALIGLATIFVSCEKCKRCSYTYTVTEIQQTINGEQEVVSERTGVLEGPDGETFSEECIKESKDESFTIEQWYQNKADTTVLDNFAFTCEDL